MTAIAEQNMFFVLDSYIYLATGYLIKLVKSANHM